MGSGKRGLIILLATILAIGCGPSEEEKASAKLQQVRMLLQEQDTIGALLQIDSMVLLYPKAAYALNGAQNLKREIHWNLYQLKQAELDSTVAWIARLTNGFIKGKGEFERFATYTHKRQIPEQNLSRSYLKAEVTENGDLILVSQYVGKQPVNHTSVRISEGDLEAFTDTVPRGDAANYQGGFLGARWERVTYRNEVNRRVAALVAANPGKKFKLTFSGTGQYVVFLEQTDKTAIREVYELSVLIRRRQQLEKEIKGLDIR